MINFLLHFQNDGLKHTCTVHIGTENMKAALWNQYVKCLMCHWCTFQPENDMSQEEVLKQLEKELDLDSAGEPGGDTCIYIFGVNVNPLQCLNWNWMLNVW